MIHRIQDKYRQFKRLFSTKEKKNARKQFEMKRMMIQFNSMCFFLYFEKCFFSAHTTTNIKVMMIENNTANELLVSFHI